MRPREVEPNTVMGGQADTSAVAGNLRDRIISVVEALHAGFPNRLIIESSDHDPASIYAETHFVLACVLLHLTGNASHERLTAAEERLRRWKDQVTKDKPFDDLANC